MALPGPSLLEQVLLAPLLLRAPYLALPHLYERYGPVVALGAGPTRYVLLLGREANQLVLADSPSSFEWRPATKPLVAVDGDTAMVVSDGADHARRRRVVQPEFAVRAVSRHVPAVVEEVDRMVDGWAPGDRVDVHTEVRRAIRRTVVRSLFGDDLGERADELGAHLEIPIAYVMDRIPGFRVDIDLPGLSYARSQRARRQADRIVFDTIEMRHRHGGDDVLARLVASADDPDGGLSDVEVRDQVVSLVAAGYYTTSAAVAWTVHALWSRDEVLGALRAELDAIAGDGDLSWDRIAAMPYLDAVVRESLRLWPPGPFGGRRTTEPVQLDGKEVPAGTQILYSPYLTHRLPELWPQAETFLPERWIGGSPEHHEPAPYAYVPFGAGARQCIGFQMATMNVKVAVARLVQRADLRLAAHRLHPSGLGVMVPASGVRATVLAGPS